MTQSEWTLTAELCRLSRQPALSEALTALGLIETPESDFELRELSAWHRGGAETYVYTFAVLQSIRVQKCILKAMVAATPTTPPERQLEKWLTRRHRLAEFGVMVPRLFGAGDGVLLEEFIETDAIEQLRSDATERTSSPSIQDRLESLCALVYQAGFRPVCILPNLRLANDELFWIDFGSDLGEPDYGSVSMPSPRETIVGEIENYVWSSLGNPSNG